MGLSIIQVIGAVQFCTCESISDTCTALRNQSVAHKNFTSSSSGYPQHRLKKNKPRKYCSPVNSSDNIRLNFRTQISPEIANYGRQRIYLTVG